MDIFKKIRIKMVILYRVYLFKCNVFFFYKNVKIDNAKIIQIIEINGKGKIIINNKSQVGVYPSPGFKYGHAYIEARNESSKIQIGNEVIINNNCTLIAEKTTIEIGDRTLIGPFFTCFDSNFHSLDPSKRLGNEHKCKPVIIGENVFIGSHVTVLAGVTIGNNSVIGAGVVVRKNVPANVIYNGTDIIPLLKC